MLWIYLKLSLTFRHFPLPNPTFGDTAVAFENLNRQG
jgi:hypothetical protein